MQVRNKPVVLLVAEAVTLAHFARIVTLAKALDPELYEVVVASDPRYISLENPVDYAFHPIRSIPSEDFEQALARGKPLYSVETLTRYVEDDLELIDRVKPDLVVGDFRLSLAVSAPLRHIPYAAVVNAYWSPYADVAYPVPDLPFTRITGLTLGQALFDLVRPFAFALHSRPLNQVRRKYGLDSLGSDLRKTYTWADHTLYADIHELIHTRDLPGNHSFLGPILWSTKTPLPDWWDTRPQDKPFIFLSLGSSGRAELLPMIIDILSGFPNTVIAATAGKVALKSLPPNVYSADYLPMDIASAGSVLVISNGGNLTTYQALANSAPVIGLCSNMDQLLNMNAIEHLGAGISLRATRVTSKILMGAVADVLDNPSFAQKASQIGQILARTNRGQRFRDFVSEILR